MKLVLLGPPGAGKGTQAAELAKSLSIPTISTGNIIRAAVKEGTPIGVIAKGYIDKGELVPDETVVSLVEERLKADDCKNGYILDGFPRTITQAEIMEEKNMEVDKVVNIELADEIIVERLSGRRVCLSCGAAYHVKFNPPKEDGICDVCSDKLVIRDDDKEEVILNRLSVYHSQTEPLIDFYEKREKLTSISGEGDVKTTTALAIAAATK